MMAHFDPLKPGDGQKFYFNNQDGGRLMPGQVRGRYRPILKATQQGVEPVYGADADGVHIGATWRIRLNGAVRRRCGLMSNYFDHLFTC